MYKDFFKLNNVPPLWDEFLEEQERFLCDTAKQLAGSEDFTPTADRALRFLNMPPEGIKVVILGQDPYPQRGAASGRAFEFCLIDDWTNAFAQVSLKNIVRAIYHSKTGRIVKWNELKKEIAEGRFKIARPAALFDSWERQGVLCLNTSFTCRIGKPNSHKKIWSGFCRDLVEYISEKNPNAYWFLWGSEARQFESPIIAARRRALEKTKDTEALPRDILCGIFTARHPMLCGLEVPDDFLKCRCFDETSDIIDWCGTDEIKKQSNAI